MSGVRLKKFATLTFEESKGAKIEPEDTEVDRSEEMVSSGTPSALC